MGRSFLDLPFEVRQRIYELFFYENRYLHLRLRRVDPSVGYLNHKPDVYRYVRAGVSPVTLLDTCHLIRSEALRHIESHFQLILDISMESACPPVANIPLPLSLAGSVRELNLVTDTPCTFWPQNQMPHLRLLFVDAHYDTGLTLLDDWRAPEELVDDIEEWHSDLLDAREAPRGAALGLVQAILRPERKFAVQWRGKFKYMRTRCRDGRLDPYYEICFDWDTRELLLLGCRLRGDCSFLQRTPLLSSTPRGLHHNCTCHCLTMSPRKLPDHSPQP